MPDPAAGEIGKRRDDNVEDQRRLSMLFTLGMSTMPTSTNKERSVAEPGWAEERILDSTSGPRRDKAQGRRSFAQREPGLRPEPCKFWGLLHETERWDGCRCVGTASRVAGGGFARCGRKGCDDVSGPGSGDAPCGGGRGAGCDTGCESCDSPSRREPQGSNQGSGQRESRRDR